MRTATFIQVILEFCHQIITLMSHTKLLSAGKLCVVQAPVYYNIRADRPCQECEVITPVWPVSLLAVVVVS